MNKREYSFEYALLSCVYHMFILYLSCVVQINVIPVHEYSCRIADRDMAGLSYEEQLDYKGQVLQKRENELKNYTVKEKEKTDKIINKIKE